MNFRSNSESLGGLCGVGSSIRTDTQTWTGLKIISMGNLHQIVVINTDFLSLVGGGGFRVIQYDLPAEKVH